MIKINHKTISAQIIIPACLLTVLMLVALGAGLILKAKTLTEAIFESKGQSLANLLEKLSAPYIVNFDYPSLETFVAEAIKDPDVSFAVVFDTKKTALTTSSEEPSDKSGLTLYEREIKDSDSEQTVGHLRLGYSRDSLKKSFNESVINTILTILAGILVMGLGLGFITRRVIHKVKGIISNLTLAYEEIRRSSAQVASASQVLAEGSSQQAASLEETSASLEEVASMTKQNADHAIEADRLMKDTVQVVDKAGESMRGLTASMNEISRASEETSKIIKTIDEIAFQTNLLALNAAVEAARAGQTGAGFAVVADEVRNLAMRAAEAAKNTADLIEGTVKKVKDGAALVGRTNETFDEVAGSAGKVAHLVGEIAASSTEQAQGIEQVNKAASEMDKVTQQNAANAEESASASEELNAQAARMKAMVAELVTMVGGSSNGRKSGKKAQMKSSGSRANRTGGDVRVGMGAPA